MPYCLILSCAVGHAFRYSAPFHVGIKLGTKRAVEEAVALSRKDIQGARSSR